MLYQCYNLTKVLLNIETMFQQHWILTWVHHPKYLWKIAFKLNNTSLNYFLWIHRVVNNANKAFFIIYGWICKYYRCNLFKTYKKCYYYVACLPAHRHKFSSVSRQFIEVELHFIPKWSLLKIGQFIKLDNK